jgi:hypothetical protein
MGKRLGIGVATLFFLKLLVSAQAPGTPTGDLFEQRVGGVRLEDQSIVAGIVSVTRSVGLPLSIEYPLGMKVSGPEPQLKTATASVGPGTVAQVLDRLCDLDPTFTWTRTGDMVNVTLRALANDPSYLLNRRVDLVTFEGVREADDAVMKAVGQLPGPREQIAVLQVGLSLDFASPWSVTFKGVTVREVFDHIAQQLGPSYGWEFSGAQDFRMVTFHEALQATQSRSKQLGPQNLRPR